MQEEDELLDLVNADDQVIGSIWRSQYDQFLQDKLGYIRAIDMFIINDEGQLWIPKRPAHKRIAPNGLDYSCGGHVGSGETYMQSALREIEEELNLKLKPEDLRPLKKFLGNDLRYIREVYTYHSNVTPDYNPDDFVSAEWMMASELIAKLDSGVPAKTSIRETVQEVIDQGLSS